MLGTIRVKVQNFGLSESDESVATLRGVRTDQQHYGYRPKEGEELGPVLITGVPHSELSHFPVPGDILELEVAVICMKYQRKEFKFGQQKTVPRWGVNMVYYGGIRFANETQTTHQQRSIQTQGVIANPTPPPAVKDSSKQHKDS